MFDILFLRDYTLVEDTHWGYINSLQICLFKKELFMNENEKTCSCCSACEHHKHTPRTDEQLKALTDRLNRIIGQLNGIKNMIADNRYCGDVLMQVSAVESALQSFGYVVLTEHLKTCVVENVQQGNVDILDEAVDLIKKLK